MPRPPAFLALALTLAFASMPSFASTAPTPDAVAVAAVLDDFHAAAAAADEARYFGHLADNAVFLGTDATERWTKSDFLAFARPHFSQGKGWTFTPRDRHVDFAAEGRIAWFDELLDSATYGECRGTGLLEKGPEGWKILQYHLTIPIPNALADELVAQIRRSQSKEE